MILSKCTILMVPRTGSTWARQAIRSARIKYREPGGAAGHAAMVPDGAPRFVIAFTRQPESWLKSRWMLGPWEDELRLLWVRDYATFRGRVTDDMIHAYFERYTRLCQPGFVGTQENLGQDLITALTMAGEKFDPAAILATSAYNVSDYDSLELVERPGRKGNECRQPAFTS